MPTRDPAVHTHRLKFAKAVVRRGAPYMTSIAFSEEHDVNTNDHSNRRVGANNEDFKFFLDFKD